jgi:hypothetical protein
MSQRPETRDEDDEDPWKLCSACRLDPDPRGPSACAACRELNDPRIIHVNAERDRCQRELVRLREAVVAAAEVYEQRAALIAEVGTLKAKIMERDAAIERMRGALEVMGVAERTINKLL